jgi:hypothetical protein
VTTNDIPERRVAVTIHDYWNDNHPDDPTGEESIDTEAMGRLLLERQSPAERDQAREIFRELLDGTSVGQLREQINDLAQLTVEEINRSRRDTRWR